MPALQHLGRDVNLLTPLQLHLCVSNMSKIVHFRVRDDRSIKELKTHFLQR